MVYNRRNRFPSTFLQHMCMQSALSGKCIMVMGLIKKNFPISYAAGRQQVRNEPKGKIYFKQ